LTQINETNESQVCIDLFANRRGRPVTASRNPLATEHLPFFITAPRDTDVLFNITLVFTIAMIVLTGVVFLTIHSLPDRIAHKSKKVQLDVVCLLCLLSLLTHENILWVAALILAFLDIPDFLTPVNRIAASVETIAEQESAESPSTDHSEPIPPKVAIANVPRQDQKGFVSSRSLS
jgi:multisubunit Na+/H+ antiporter MnhF subunit